MSTLGILLLLGLCLVPGFEPRYVIALGIAEGLPLHIVLAISLTGTVLLTTLLIYTIPLIDKLMKFIQNTSLRKISELYFRYIESLRKRASKYTVLGLVGIILFIAIPVPATGMWTGALLSHLLGLNRSKMYISILIGGLLSQLIVLTGYISIHSILKAAFQFPHRSFPNTL